MGIRNLVCSPHIEVKRTSGFGMADVSMWERKLFDPAISKVLGILKGESYPHRSHARTIKAVEDLFEICLKRTEDNWLTVYSLLGYPPVSHLYELKSCLSQLRSALLMRDREKVENGLGQLIRGNLFLPLWNYENRANWISRSDFSGWVYILNQEHANPDVLKIGMTQQTSYKPRVQSFNRQTLVLYPFSVKMVYPVRHARAAETRVFEQLSQFRIRKDREFFEIPIEEAITQVEDILTEARVLNRPQGVVKRVAQVTGLGRGLILSSIHGEVFMPQTELEIRYSPGLIGTIMEFDPSFMQGRIVALRGNIVHEQLTLEQFQEV